MKTFKNVILLTSIFYLFQIHIFPQEKMGLGLILDDPSLELIPKAPNLMRGDYSNLPSKVSLKEYAPTPGDQGGSSTCAGWAIGYGARTILYSITNGLNSKSLVDSNTFSPSYIYNQIRSSPGCDIGASLFDGLDLLKNKGVLPFREFGFECDRKVSASDSLEASKYKILEYRSVAGKGENKTNYVKKSLAERKPVVIAMDIPPTFFHAEEHWKPDSSEYKRFSVGHALTVVGYDDHKFGGSFELMNSWGAKTWGNGGFTWISYDDFNYFCDIAVEILEKPQDTTDYVILSGSLSFVLVDGNIINLTHNGSHFITQDELADGTLFRLIISNDQPAYVYAFASDLTYDVTKIFPADDKIIPYLPYRGNNISIPDEDSYHYLQKGSGNTFYCFLYSTELLNIDDIIIKIKNSEGKFPDRLKNVLGNDSIDLKDIHYEFKNRLNFKALSKSKKVLPILIEILHLK